MSGNKDIFQKAMDEGHSAAWDQSWERAAGFYRQALEQFPEHHQALTSLGLALFELEDYEGALRAYAKAAMVSPDDPVPLEKISQSYEQMGNLERARAASLQAAELHLKKRDVDKAIENWGRVTSFQPDNFTARSRLALVYERLGKANEAVAEYLVLAALFQRANDLEKAMRAVQHAQKLKPGNTGALNALNLLNEQKPLPLPGHQREVAPQRRPRSRQLETSKASSAAQGLDPVTEARQKALSELAGVLFDIPDEEQGTSRRGFQTIVRGTGKLRSRPVDYNRIVLYVGQVVEMQTQGDFAQAALELERAIDAGLDIPAAYYDLGFLQFHNQNLESATRNLQLALQHPDFVLAARLLLGQIYQRKGELREAAVEYLEALRQADTAIVPPDQADVLEQLYEPMVETQSQETNEQVQQQVCENISELLIRANWRDHLRQARQQLPVQTDGGPPVPLAEIVVQARSSHIVESLTKIYQLERSGYLRSAIEEALFALEYAPTYLHLHVTIGELLLKLGEVEEAIEKFQVVAQAYSSRGEPRQALRIYRRVIELAPIELVPRERLIELLTSMGRIEEALEEYMGFAEVHYSLADLEKARKTYVDAMRLAQKAQADRSIQIRILHRLADIDLQSLDWREALRGFEQVRTLDPSDEEARSRIVEINFRLGQESRALAELDNYLEYLDGRGKNDLALKFLEAQAKEEPQRVSLIRRLAERYHQAGQTSEAIAKLDEAGEILMQIGDVNEAIQVVERILALRPPNAEEYQKLLRQLKSES